MICNKKLNATLLKKGRVDCIFFASSSSFSNRNKVNTLKHGIKLGQLKNLNTYTTILKQGRIYSIFFASSSSSSNRNISKHGIKLRQLENFNMCTTVKSIKRTMQDDL